MSIFIDTGVFYAHHDKDASRHDVGVTALNRILTADDHGRAVTSDYIYDEAVTVTHRRTGRIDAAIELGRRIRGDGYPDAIDLLHSSVARFDDAIDIFETYDDHELSFTDAMTIALVEYHEVDGVLSFDDDFDGIVRRIDPATV